LNEAQYGDTLTITTEPLRLGEKSYVLKQKAYNQYSEHLISAIVTIVMFDLNNRKSTQVIEEISSHF